MAARRRHHEAVGRRPRADEAAVIGLRRTGAEPQPQPFGFAADDASPQQSLRRRGDDAGDRQAVRHDGDVDRELVAAGEKLLGAVERVDDHEARLQACRRRAADAFLRDHRDAGQQAGDAFHDDGFRCDIGGGNGRKVVLDMPFDR